MNKSKAPQNPVIARFTVQGLASQTCRYHVTRVGNLYQVSIHMNGKSVNIGKGMAKKDAMKSASNACDFGSVKVDEYFRVIM